MSMSLLRAGDPVTSRVMLSATILLFVLTPAFGASAKVKLSGIVIDSSGMPKADVDVGFQWGFLGHRLAPYNWVFTDRNGRFEVMTDNFNSEGVVVAFSDNRELGCVQWVKSTELSEQSQLKLQPTTRLRFRMVCSKLNTVISSGLIEIEAVNPKTPPLPGDSRLKPLHDWYAGLPEGMTVTSSLGTPTYTRAEIELRLPPGKFLLRFNSAYMQDISMPLTITAMPEDREIIEIDLEPEPLAPLLGKPAPNWNIADVRGLDRNSQTKDFIGKWLLIQFWNHADATSVKQAIPRLIDFHQKHPVFRDKVQIIAVHVGDVDSVAGLEEKLDARNEVTWKHEDLPFPLIVDNTGHSMNAFHIAETPGAIVIDPKGNVGVYYGLSDFRRVLEGTLRHNIRPIETVYPRKNRQTKAETSRSSNHVKLLPVHRLTDHQAAIESLAVNAATDSVYTTGMDMTLSHYDLKSAKRVTHVKTHDQIQFSSLAPRLLFDRKRNRILSTKRPKEVDRFHNQFAIQSYDEKLVSPAATPFPEFTGDVRLAMAGDSLVAVQWDQRKSYSTFRLYEVESADVMRSWKSLIRIHDMACSPNGKTLVCGNVTSERLHSLTAFDTSTGKQIWSLPLQSEHHGAIDIAFSADGRFVVASSWEDEVRIRDAETGIVQRTLKLHNHHSMCAAFSPDGTLLATGGSGISPSVVWNLKTGERVAALIGHQFGRTHRMQFVNNSRLASVGGKMELGELCIWDLPENVRSSELQ